MAWAIWTGLAVLLLGLGWVGWSFFYQSNPALLQLALPDIAIWRINPFYWPQRLRSLKVSLRLPALSLPGMLRFRGRVAWGKSATAGLLLGSVLVALSMVMTLSMARRRHSVPVLPRTFQQSEQIRSALSMEKLVPPPPLPPDAFVDRQHPGLEKLDRDWGRMDGEFVQQVLKLRARMQARGYLMALVEGYRSPERQNQLAGMDQHVTNARAFQSKHQFGFAADLAPVRDGHIVISEKDPWAMSAYQSMGEEAEALGLVWGGRWTFRDYGHVELAGSIAKLLKTRQQAAAASVH